jgi:hypothetical protein
MRLHLLSRTPHRLRCIALACIVCIVAGSEAEGAAADAASPHPRPDPLAGETVVAIWNEATLEGIREASVPAPIAARMLAIVNTAMYDAWAAYDPIAAGTDGTSRLRRPSSERSAANARRAIGIAAYYALRDVSAVPMADVTLLQSKTALGTNDMPERVGKAVADAVLASRHSDGSNQLGDLHPGIYSDYTGYRSTNTASYVRDPNHWQPLLIYNESGGFTTQSFLVPQWGSVTPFAVDPAAFLHSFGTPLAAGTDAYRQQAQDIVDISAHLTDEQKTIAEYWADGMMTDSPPGHWMRFGIWISKRDHHDASTDARMFFALSNALLDAGIVCWRAKRLNDSVRPITAIHTLFAHTKIYAWAGPGKGARWIDGSAWQPYQSPEIVTPAFPEFFSGHSTFSAAAAEVLRRFTDSDTFGDSYTQAAGTSLFEPGVPAKPVTLAWPTFSAAADQAGISRRYGGIHFETGDVAGRRAGRAIGALAFDRAAAYISGRPPAPPAAISSAAVSSAAAGAEAAPLHVP